MIYNSLDDAIKSIFGAGTIIKNQQGVGGGDINKAQRIELSNGVTVFVKSNKNKEVGFYEDECNGIEAIATTDTIQTPKILAIGKDSSYGAFLMMEYVDSTRKIDGFWETFAVELSEMHQAETESFVVKGKYGYLKDNYIGSRVQINNPNDSWIDFFRVCRLQPRFEAAESYFGFIERKQIRFLLDHLDKWLIEPKHPSLIHGDLWGGNFIVGSDGKAWLIDPAVYVGHAEADIAMTELFGGFSRDFYEAYTNTGEIEKGYENRREIYNLYHLLNHLISFGSTYYGAVRRTLDYYAGKC